MHEEAEILINGTALTDEESMTIRVAIDTLSNVLAEDVGQDDNRQIASRYVASLTRIQELLDSRPLRKQ
ncbi:MAG: hypothetical protein M3O06_01085 [Pseudomonadota bacterium]|nr:hypothetical protein [Pseudomonadota bacterium]